MKKNTMHYIAYIKWYAFSINWFHLLIKKKYEKIFKGQKWRITFNKCRKKKWFTLLFSAYVQISDAQLVLSPSIFPCTSCLYPYEFSAYMHKWIPIICTCTFPYNLCPHLHNLHLGTCAFPSLCSPWPGLWASPSCIPAFPCPFPSNSYSLSVDFMF